MSIAKIFANDAHRLRKSCEGLLGICSGILADNTINEAEVRFLHQWLLDHKNISSEWPGDVIAKRIRDIVADGIITNDELLYLRQTLSDLIGGTLQETGATSGIASSLPLNNESAVPVVFKDSAFCFTGSFLYGTRSSCERAVQKLGGQCFEDVRMNLDYLVIGSLASPDWANSSYGRKIEKAISYQQKGRQLLIINEEHWIKHIQ